jgi:hypothetical protein
MRFIAQRLLMVGSLLFMSSILLLPLIAVAAEWYVSKNLGETLNLDLLTWDLCRDAVAIGTMEELAITGLIILPIAAFLGAFNWLRCKSSN